VRNLPTDRQAKQKTEDFYFQKTGFCFVGVSISSLVQDYKSSSAGIAGGRTRYERARAI